MSTSDSGSADTTKWKIVEEIISCSLQ